jgi:hypothetical protein
LYLDPVSRFRVLVVLSSLCYVLLLVGPWVFWSNLSREASDVLSWRGLDAILPLTAFPYYLLLMLWLAAAVGMYFFINAARALYAALAAFNLLVFLLGGMDTRLAVESFLIQFTTMADGAIIAIAYWSPLSKKFEVDAGTPRETPATGADE